jgi:uncharacterized membrane protein HdeD (DUF308 family)
MLILVGNWWALALRGLLGVALGVLTLTMPAATFRALLLVFGGYALVDGVLGVITAVRGARGDRSWWALLVSGLAGVVIGLGTVGLPARAALVLLYVIAVWAVLTGGLEIAAAVRLREQIRDEWLLALSGGLTIAFGVLVMIAPAAGALAVILLIGAYALLSGLARLALSLRLRAAGRRPPSATVRRAA